MAEMARQGNAMFEVWTRQLGELSGEANVSAGLTLFSPPKVNTPTPAPQKPAAKKPAAKKTASAAKPSIATVPANFGSDELIAGARLQWSVMLGLPAGTATLKPSTAFAERTDALRRLMANASLQQVQVTTSSFDTASWLAGKTYAGKFVAEVTTPMNRARKADLHWDLEQMAISAKLLVDPNPAHNNLALMRQGGGGTQGGLPDEPYRLPGDRPKDDAWEKLLESLGLSAPWAMVAGGLALVLILRR
jgi:hypothetical protein